MPFLFERAINIIAAKIGQLPAGMSPRVSTLYALMLGWWVHSTIGEPVTAQPPPTHHEIFFFLAARHHCLARDPPRHPLSHNIRPEPSRLPMLTTPLPRQATVYSIQRWGCGCGSQIWFFIERAGPVLSSFSPGQSITGNTVQFRLYGHAASYNG